MSRLPKVSQSPNLATILEEDGAASSRLTPERVALQADVQKTSRRLDSAPGTKAAMQFTAAATPSAKAQSKSTSSEKTDAGETLTTTTGTEAATVSGRLEVTHHSTDSITRPDGESATHASAHKGGLDSDGAFRTETSEKTNHQDSAGNSHTDSHRGEVTLKNGDVTLHSDHQTKETQVTPHGTSITTERKEDLILGDDTFTFASSGKDTARNLDGTSTTTGSGLSVGENHLNLNGSHAHTTRSDQDSTHTHGVNGEFKVSGADSSVTLDGHYDGTHTRKDDFGNRTTTTTGLDVNFIDPILGGDVSTRYKTTGEDGSTVSSHMGTVGRLSERGVDLEASTGHTKTYKRGGSLMHNCRFGLDVSDEATTLEGHGNVGFSVPTGAEGMNRIGGNATGDVTLNEDGADLKGQAGLFTEATTVEGDQSTTNRGEATARFNTVFNSISFSTGVKTTITNKGRTSVIGGQVGVSNNEGVKASGRFHLSEANKDGFGLGAGGNLRPDGVIGFNGNVDYQKTDPDTNNVNNQGVGGLVTGDTIFIGGHCSETRPDGNVDGGQVNLLIHGGTPKIFMGGSNLQSTTTAGGITDQSGISNGILLGNGDITFVARQTNAVLTPGRILPTSMNQVGMFASFNGNQLTTVGEQIKDPTHPNVGYYPLHTTRITGGTLGGDGFCTLANAGGVPLGIGGTLSLTRQKNVQYRTHVAQNEAEDLVIATGPTNRARKIAWVNLIDAPVDIPDLTKPENLRMGDLVQVDTTGNVEVGLYGSAAILLQAGARVSLTGEFQLSVEKTDDHLVEVECVPTRIIGAKLFASAVFADAYVSETIAQQIGQKFQFDLNTITGRRAYQNALKGRLPGRLAQKDLDPQRHNLEKLQGELPPGIKRLQVSRTTSRQRAAKAKAGWLFLQVGARHSRTRTVSLKSDGETSTNQKLYTRATEYTTPLRGSEENGVTGCFQSTTTKVGPNQFATHFDGYKATAYFTDTKVRGDQYATRMVQVLNKELDLGLVEPTVESPRKLWRSPCTARSRRLEASIEFTPEDIVDFRNTDPDLAAEAGQRHGIEPALILDFVRAIGESKTPIRAAEHLGEFLRSHGRSGLGVLMKLALIEPKDVVLTTESGSYSEVIKDSSTYLLENGNPLTADAKKTGLTTRFKRGEKLQNDLALGLEMIADDPVLDLSYNQSERDQLLEDLKGKQEAVNRAMAFDHLTPTDGLILWNTLGRGWVSGAQGRARNKIIEDTNLTVHYTGRTHTDASAIENNEEGHNEISLQTTQRWLPLFGDERTLIAAAVNRTTNEDETRTSQSFTVEARITDEELKWQGMNHRFVEEINQAYGLDFQKSAVAARGEQQLVLRQRFSAEDLNRIALVPSEKVEEALQEAGVPADKAGTIGWAISAASSRENLVDVLQLFIRDYGLVATGALSRISAEFDAPAPLVVDSFSGAIQSDLRKLAKTAAQFKDPLQSNTPVTKVHNRFKKVKNALKALGDLKTRVEDYPFSVAVEGDQQRQDVEAVRENLESSINLSRLSHHAMVNLCRETSELWNSQLVNAVLTKLKEDTGLRRIEISPSGASRFSEALKTGDDRSATLECNLTEAGECSGKTLILGRMDTAGSLKSVEVTTSLFESNTTKKQLEKNFIEPLDRHLDNGTPGIFRFPDQPHERRVRVQTSFTAEEINQLSQLSSGFVREIAKRSSFSHRKVAGLLIALKQADSGLKQAEAVGRFLAHMGLEGLGAFKVLLNLPDSRMTLTSSNGLVEKLKTEVKDTLSLYENTALTDALILDLTDRFEALYDAEDKVAAICVMVSTDPLLTDSHIQTSLGNLDQLGDRLRAALANDRSQAMD